MKATSDDEQRKQLTWFAGVALHALMTTTRTSDGEPLDFENEVSAEHIANTALTIADVMAEAFRRWERFGDFSPDLDRRG